MVGEAERERQETNCFPPERLENSPGSRRMGGQPAGLPPFSLLLSLCLHFCPPETAGAQQEPCPGCPSLRRPVMVMINPRHNPTAV